MTDFTNVKIGDLYQDLKGRELRVTNVRVVTEVTMEWVDPDTKPTVARVISDPVDAPFWESWGIRRKGG